MSSNRTKAS